jgi:hypothetical protein
MEQQEPLYRVVRGTPTAEELAALTVVLLAAATPDGPNPPGARPRSFARWHRLERVGGFEGARTWQRTSPVTH